MRPMRICGVLIAVLLLGTAAFWLMRRAIAEDRRFVADQEAKSPFLSDPKETSGSPSDSRSNDQPAQPGQPAVIVRPESQVVEVERRDESKTEAQRAVVKVVLVFFQDISRRAIDGIMFDTGSETWIVTASTATLVPPGTTKAIDRVIVEHTPGSAVDADFVSSDVPGLFFCRVPGRIGSYRLTDRDTVPSLAVGDSLLGLNVNVVARRLFREPTEVKVAALNRIAEYKLEDGSPKEFSNLIQFSGSLSEGTPLFKNGELAGITVLGKRFLGENTEVGFALPIERIHEACRRAVAMDEAERRLAQGPTVSDTVAARRVPKADPTTTAKDDAETPKPLSAPATTTQQSPFTDDFWPKLKMGRQIFSITWLEAEDAAKTLRSLYLDEANGQGIVRIAANTSSNTIIVSAPADTLKGIEETLKLLEEKAQHKAAWKTLVPGRGDGQPNPLTAKRLSPLPIDEKDTKFERDVQQLAAQVRAAQGPNRGKLRADLEQITDQHFEYRQQHRKQEIDDLAKRVDQMRASHARRNEQKAEIIKRRIADLLNEDSSLWDETRAVLSKSTGPQPIAIDVELPLTKSEPEPKQ